MVDANVFIHGSSRQLPFDDVVVPPAVTAELESVEARQRFDAADIDVREPSDDALATVRETADAAGEALSEADVAVLAVALDLDATVVSDDYGVQHVARRLDLAFEGYLQEETAEDVDWVWRCAACGETFDGATETCSRCGGDVSRVSR